MTEMEQMALENLAEWIFDEDKIVSFKWLSFTLSMHVNESKRILEKFVAQNKDKPGCQLSVMYCISGHAANSGFQVFKVELVAEEFLKEIEASFIPPVSRHVYSVQKSANSISNLFIADYDLIKQNILSSNKFSAIYCPSAHLRVPSSTVHSVPEEVVVAPSNNQNKVEKSKLNAVPIGVSSFFAKQAQKTSSIVSKPSESGKHEPGFQPTDAKANASSLFGSNSFDADSHQLSHISNGKNANKELHKVKEKVKAGQRKRLRIAEISSSEDEEEEDPLAENPKDTDIEMISPSENSSIPVPSADDSASTEPEANQKRLERKLVSKTYINNEGFMVTEKVWETSEVMLDSVPVEKLTIEQPPPSKKPTIPLQQSSAAKKKSGASKGSNKQASLMKFFNKQ